MTEADRETRRLDPSGNPIEEPAFTIPLMANETNAAPEQVDIRDLATILRAILASISSVKEFKEWRIDADAETQEFLRIVEFSIRTYLKAPAATDVDPLFIWALAANGSGEPEAPLLEQ